MRVLIAADKFKNSLSQREVSSAIEAGLKRSQPSADVDCVVVSDGGEGFLDSVESAIDRVNRHVCDSLDPIGRPIQAEFLFEPTTETAYIELAAASGIELLSAGERDPSRTSTFGTGLVIEAALLLGAKHVYVGIGGSATTDGGIGLASALGFRFLGESGIELCPNGGSLVNIRSVRSPKSNLSNVRFFVINDVDNPLFGQLGAAHVYGPQKGADAEMVHELDAGLRNLDQCVQRDLAIKASDLPGAGAAGGAGYGLHVFLAAEFCSGANFVLGLSGIDKILSEQKFDWIITGEGQIDEQTGNGKLVDEVGKVGTKFGVPVAAFCGVNQLSVAAISGFGLTEVVAIHDPQLRTSSDSMANAKTLLEQSAFEWAEAQLRTDN